jgi:hypothetical protein
MMISSKTKLTRKVWWIKQVVGCVYDISVWCFLCLKYKIRNKRAETTSIILNAKWGSLTTVQPLVLLQQRTSDFHGPSLQRTMERNYLADYPEQERRVMFFQDKAERHVRAKQQCQQRRSRPLRRVD